MWAGRAGTCKLQALPCTSCRSCLGFGDYISRDILGHTGLWRTHSALAMSPTGTLLLSVSGATFPPPNGEVGEARGVLEGVLKGSWVWERQGGHSVVQRGKEEERKGRRRRRAQERVLVCLGLLNRYVVSFWNILILSHVYYARRRWQFSRVTLAVPRGSYGHF